MNLNATEPESDSQRALSSDPDGFFIEAEELELWRIAQEISLFFGENVVVYSDCKNMKISCNLHNLCLEKSLDLVSWLSGVEWYTKDSIYYLGGNKDYIEVLDNTGIDKTITSVFGNSNVKIIEDKIVVSGTEREVKRISNAIKELQQKRYVLVRIWGYEITEDAMIKLGLDIEKSIKYAGSWNNIVSNGYNPVQSLAVTLAASVEADRTGENLSLIMDTQLTCISGKSQNLTVGDETDRTINSTNEQGNVYTASFDTLKTGYTLSLSPYLYNDNDWIFDVKVDNSNQYSELRRNRLQLNNTVLLRQDEPSLIGRVIKQSETERISKGIPFLCEIPYLGYLFRVSEERKVKRHILYFVERLGSANAEEIGRAHV